MTTTAVVLIVDESDLAALSRAAAREVNRLGGRDAAPESLSILVDAIRHRPPSTPATRMDSVHDAMHAALMSDTEAAALLGVSTTTVGRMVKRGTLVRVGRRITRASLVAVSGRGIPDLLAGRDRTQP